MQPVGKTHYDLGRYAGIGLIVALILFVLSWYYFGGDILGPGMPATVIN